MAATPSLFYARISTETNSFSNIPTSLESFESERLLRGDDVVLTEGKPRSGLQPLFDLAAHQGMEVRGGIAADAAPGAPVQHADYLALRDELCARLEKAAPLGAVVLFLHGAMQSTECQDCEGDILAAVRRIAGEETPICAILDPHAHLTALMVETADFLIFMKEYPHIDGAERLREACDLVRAMIADGLSLHGAVVDCQAIGFFPTDRGPMRTLLARMVELEQSSDVHSVSFVQGFPWGDTPDTGAKVLAYATDPECAAAAAEDIHRHFNSIKAELRPELASIETAMSRIKSGAKGPIAIADVCDNPGGGAPSDSTFLLRALIENGVENSALGLLFDPVSVRMCHQVGPGGVINLRLGGKTSRFSGDPIDGLARVIAVRRDAFMDVAPGVRFAMGDTAWIEFGGVDLVLSTIRMQMYAPSGFSHLGLDPATKTVLVVKSSNHFRAFFGDLVSEIIDVQTPGAMNFDFASLPYQHVRVEDSPGHAAGHAEGTRIVQAIAP